MTSPILAATCALTTISIAFAIAFSVVLLSDINSFYDGVKSDLDEFKVCFPQGAKRN